MERTWRNLGRYLLPSRFWEHFALSFHRGPPPEDKIHLFDSHGREVLVTRQAWRETVLPASIRQEWNNVNELYGLLCSALGDGLGRDILKPAKHLYDLDRNSSRSACLYGLVLVETGALEEAESVLCNFLSAKGEDGYALLNLAKIYSAKGDLERSSQHLWRSLETDPNIEDALTWYSALAREQGGLNAQRHAWRRVAALPNSWRAQLYLARESLAQNHAEDAITQYRQAMLNAGDPAPMDLLMQMTGDLGKSGRSLIALRLAEPLYLPTIHGFAVGNNLIKAHLDCGEPDGAQRIVRSLNALKRPDYRAYLDYWDTEITKARNNRESETKPNSQEMRQT